ncbi:MAG: hypothetical protein ABFD50_22145 [Smithella sp.]
MEKFFLVIFLCFIFIIGCATTDKKENSDFSGASSGIMQLNLPPRKIAAGLSQGIASVPYYLSPSLQDINRGLISANAKVTLGDTYEAAYGKKINSVPRSGDTGEAFRRMKLASEYFQRILSHRGISHANHYILTSIDTANSQGFTLFAVVYRPKDKIMVIDKYDGHTVQTFESNDRLYYEPFKKDVTGSELDIIIDWSGLPHDLMFTQKGQALMLTLAANSVINEKRSPDYWTIEKKWIEGDFETIIKQQVTAFKTKLR